MEVPSIRGTPLYHPTCWSFEIGKGEKRARARQSSGTPAHTTYPLVNKHKYIYIYGNSPSSLDTPSINGNFIAMLVHQGVKGIN